MITDITTMLILTQYTRRRNREYSKHVLNHRSPTNNKVITTTIHNSKTSNLRHHLYQHVNPSPFRWMQLIHPVLKLISISNVTMTEETIMVVSNPPLRHHHLRGRHVWKFITVSVTSMEILSNPIIAISMATIMIRLQ